MKSSFLRAAAVLLLSTAVGAGSANAASFIFSATATNGLQITGSFDGTLNGNLITNLSKILVSYNGVALAGSAQLNGYLYGSHYDSNNGWVSGGAVASLNGLQNNFLFINSDYPNNYSYTNYYYDTPNYGGYIAPGNGGNGTGVTSQSFTATQTSAVPEPATWAMMLVGFGAVGFSLRRTRQARVRFQ